MNSRLISTRRGLSAGFVFAAVLASVAPAGAAEQATRIPAPAYAASASVGAPQTVVLAGGCFWGVQAVFQHVNGVTNVLSGYSGGSKRSADYEEVSTGATGHAESVEVTFDPKVISYGEILQLYFSVAHDPTELNRQGPDEGPQYRSAIFVNGDDQRQAAESYIAQLNASGAYRRPIVTEVAPLMGFYPAENYHQNYATLHPNSPYIAINDLPKVANLKRLYPDVYRAEPVLAPIAAASK
ncbi:peptide-methionine (S)-S-oxide reductase MsrA [Methylocapsa palsarum]|uniref:Peptide methionine sulfoxide reductase MsrA n=1 Tax=Methylocapsa palsarum TaxID=1612308 RepID=A0A1I4A580_9HYPH|nr:peptide-methionine (S)-S-oxide reductase MsrA [Methylocapsa palsarum]SFK50949.1 peptide-methionine (S)-S-oxide reductase [Methylocapsa palsarum]